MGEAGGSARLVKAQGAESLSLGTQGLENSLDRKPWAGVATRGAEGKWSLNRLAVPLRIPPLSQPRHCTDFKGQGSAVGGDGMASGCSQRSVSH